YALFDLHHRLRTFRTPMHASFLHPVSDAALIGFHRSQTACVFWWMIDTFSPVDDTSPIIQDIRTVFAYLLYFLFVFKRAFIRVQPYITVVQITLFDGFSYLLLVPAFSCP